MAAILIAAGYEMAARVVHCHPDYEATLTRSLDALVTSSRELLAGVAARRLTTTEGGDA